MITIYECNDCKYCADFGGWICCLNPELKAEDVFHYAPLESKSADNCDGFGEGAAKDFSNNQLREAEAFSIALYGEGDQYMQGIREWCLQQAQP